MTDHTEMLKDLEKHNTQIWPLGYGQVMYAGGYGDLAGCLIMVPVPDTHQPSDHDADMMRELLLAEGVQSTIISFKSHADIDRLVNTLLDMKKDMLS